MTYRHILVPFDSSTYAEKALSLGIRLAKGFNSKLHILNIVEELPSTPRMERVKVTSRITGERIGIEEYMKELYQQLKHERMEMLEGKRQRLEKESVAAKMNVVVGYPPDKIIEYIGDEGIDLVVMGTRGHKRISRIAGLGSVARKISESATCPVILLH